MEVVNLKIKKVLKIKKELISHPYTVRASRNITLEEEVIFLISFNIIYNRKGVFLERIEVFSPDIASVGYDEEKAIFQVEFHNLCIYNYFEVPKEYYHKCVCADSVEQYFQANIENYYESDRIL